MANQTRETEQSLYFSATPRLLMLLGDQLIRDATLAVFELVKNAYDADAECCQVTLNHIDDPRRASILIQDDGAGMTADLLRNVWMVIGTNHRANQKDNKQRSAKGRLPLGEKGLGRLSIHKLGRYIELVTRPEGVNKEYVLILDWDRLESAKNFLSAGITLVERIPKVFLGRKHGTSLSVSQLREAWNRGSVRKLYRAVNSLCSPYMGPQDFSVELGLPGFETWLDGLFTASDAQDCALYHVTGSFHGSTGSFQYSFTPPHEFLDRLGARTVQTENIPLTRKEGRKSIPLDLSDHEIGEVKFELWLFDRDPAIMRAVTGDIKGLKDYLDENGGIRIYRDGVRVYDFGEPGNDWLNLDLRRVNAPTAKTSNNQILGALQLEAESSKGLREKANREGFIETPAYADFRDAVISMLTQVEAERSKDQKRVREATGKGTGKNVFAKLVELREVLEQKGVLTQVEPVLKSVERELEIYRDQLLHAAVPGLTMGIMLHGAEKILDELRLAARKGSDFERIKELVDRLYRAMRPVTNLLKNPGTAKTSAAYLVKEAIFSTELRMKRHQITLLNGFDDQCRDFPVQGSKQMLSSSLTNLIDNSIHWLEAKNPAQKLIYIGTSTDLDGGPAIVVADNGTGFGTDTPEDLVTPFFSRRNGGMGLGLYIVSEVMRVNNGRLIFPDDGDVELPDSITGAVVAIQFKESQ